MDPAAGGIWHDGRTPYSSRQAGRSFEYREVEVPSEKQIVEISAGLHAAKEEVTTELMGWPVFYRPPHHQRITMRPIGRPHEEIVVRDAQVAGTCWFGRKGEWLVSVAWLKGDGHPPTVSTLHDELMRGRPIVFQEDLFATRNKAKNRSDTQQRVDWLDAELADPLREGASLQVELDRYERSTEARRRCLEHYGTACTVCGVDLEEMYGSTAGGFIHVHHLVPLATLGEDHEVDPVSDLRPVCPNCHAVIHLREPPYSVEDVMEMLGHTPKQGETRFTGVSQCRD